MRKTIRLQRHDVLDFLVRVEVVNFATNVVPKIMKDLGIGNHQYAIGGSVALLMLGYDINRIPHDIDVIVPSGMLDVIKDRVKNSPYLIGDCITSSCDCEVFTNHFAFRAAKGYIIDIIETTCWDQPYNHYNYDYDGHLIMSVQALSDAKCRYNRPKDRDDKLLLEGLQDKYHTTPSKQHNEEESSTSESLDDLDALEQLKAQMEE